MAETQKIKFDFGEKRHVRINVQSITQNEETLPFLIRTAKWELLDANGVIEDSGECTIEEHELDAYISPLKQGSYTLQYTYEVADEIWIDKIKVGVKK